MLQGLARFDEAEQADAARELVLADLYLFYGEAERAAPLYRALGDARGLAACEELSLRSSSLPPPGSPPPA